MTQLSAKIWYENFINFYWPKVLRFVLLLERCAQIKDISTYGGDKKCTECKCTAFDKFLLTQSPTLCSVIRALCSNSWHQQLWGGGDKKFTDCECTALFFSFRLSHSIHAKFRDNRSKQHTPFHFTVNYRPVFRRFRLIPSLNRIKKWMKSPVTPMQLFFRYRPLWKLTVSHCRNIYNN